PTFLHFALIFVVCVILLRGLRRPDQPDDPIYAAVRQPLGRTNVTPS
ncbi:hypothetical protein LCGC14_1865570, partial [marine sediment metagenome]